MKKVFKRGIAALLAASCIAGFTGGCNGGNESTSELSPLTVVKGLPDYSADEETKKVYIGGYCAPYAAGLYDVTNPETGATSKNQNFITLEQFQMIKECEMDYVLTLYDQGTQSQNVRDSLKYAEQAGVKILVRWDAIINMGNADPEDLKNAIGEDVLAMDSFWGIFAKDEPGADFFKKLGKAEKVYKQVTDKYFYVNLFPNYANNTQLQANGYRDYVNKYCYYVENNMIIEDHYPFGHQQGSDNYGLNSTFLSNLEVIEEYATAYNKEHWEYMQGETCGAGSKVPDYYDFRLQAYINMCYGVTSMQYFCYMSPFAATDETSAFIDGLGQKTDRWYAGQKINTEIHKFDHVYLNFADNNTNVMTVIGTENTKGFNQGFEMLKNSRTSHERITSVTAQQDTVIGTYKDGDGRDGFMVVNYSVPAYRLKDKVEINFREADAAIFYKEGEYNLVELTNGKFEYELDAGEGIFVIPVKY